MSASFRVLVGVAVTPFIVLALYNLLLDVEASLILRQPPRERA